MLATSRAGDEMKRMFEVLWFYPHGAPVRFTADHGFCIPSLARFLELHGVTVKPKSSRSSIKSGKVERNNGVFKCIVDITKNQSLRRHQRTL